MSQWTQPLLLAALLLTGCESATPFSLDVSPVDAAALDVAPLPTDTGLEVAFSDVPRTDDVPDEVVDALADVPGAVDVPALEEVEEIMVEDLSWVKITWNKDIEDIFLTKCANCHGLEGSSGLKLFKKSQWEDYFPMIIPSLESGKMPKGTGLNPGDLANIILWGKVGFP